MAVKKSMTDIVYEYMAARKKPVVFDKLFDEVAKRSDIEEDKRKKKKAQLYSALSMDARFISLSGNKWDIKSRHKYNESHKNVENLDDEEVELEDIHDEIPSAEDDYN